MEVLLFGGVPVGCARKESEEVLQVGECRDDNSTISGRLCVTHLMNDGIAQTQNFVGVAMRSVCTGVNEYLMPKHLPLISEHLTIKYLQVYGNSPHFVLNALECWVEPLHIITDREFLGMRHSMYPVTVVSQILDPEV